MYQQMHIDFCPTSPAFITSTAHLWMVFFRVLKKRIGAAAYLIVFPPKIKKVVHKERRMIQ